MINNDLKKRINIIKAKFGYNDEQLVEKGGISSGTLYRMPKENGVSEKQMMLFAKNIGVSYDWLVNGIGEEPSLSGPLNPDEIKFASMAAQNAHESQSKLSPEKPLITTNSSDLAVQELVKQVNFLREQIEKKDKLIDGFIEKFLKREATEIKPLNGGGAKVVQMHREEGHLQLTGTNG